MTDPVPAPSDASAAKRRDKPAFTFTDAGCRTEVRVGSLLVLAAVFLWLWLGPEKAGRLYLVGMPLLLVGIPIQAFQARSGRPGFPWKLGIAFTVGALLMWPDLRYREAIDEPIKVQTVVPLLLIAGVWIMLWWPLAARNRRVALMKESA